MFFYVCVYPAPRIDGECEFVSSTSRSLTFRWTPAKSATGYVLVGDSKSESPTTNRVTLNDLTPGSHYTFSISAVGFQGLLSNNITCINSTGVLDLFHRIIVAIARCLGNASIVGIPCLQLSLFDTRV